ncbi:MAG: agmatinase family protein [Oligoflexales bacterium]
MQDLEQIKLGEPPAPDAGIFGLNSDDTAFISILSVPWDVTASGGKGTSLAPEKLVSASHELDLEDPILGRPYEKGIRYLPVDPCIEEWQAACEKENYDVTVVNDYSRKVDQAVYLMAKKELDRDRVVGLFGGDHSCPFGLIQALSEKYESLSILHIDAHFDLRKAYEGYERSHASIFYNVLETLPGVQVTHVGIRDFCAPELEMSRNHPRSHAFLDTEIFSRKAHGKNFEQITQEILATLSENVYISFDIDGLDPSYCPGTGTPVPGGLHYHEAVYLMEALRHKHKVVGFDLVECAAEDYDLNVGARLLYKMCGLSVKTQK